MLVLRSIILLFGRIGENLPISMVEGVSVGRITILFTLESIDCEWVWEEGGLWREVDWWAVVVFSWDKMDFCFELSKERSEGMKQRAYRVILNSKEEQRENLKKDA